MDLELNSYLPGVQEICKDELKKFSAGGMVTSALSTLAFMYAVDVAVNWSAHVSAFKKGYYQARY